MSELYRHLLIPSVAVFVPERPQLAAFFQELEKIGALPKQTEYVSVTNSGDSRALARNPTTGEVYYGPDLTIRRFSHLQAAVDAMNGKHVNELWAEAQGPAKLPPFELYGVNQPEALWGSPYSFTVRCKVRRDITHFLHPAFDCKCDLEREEPASFENPWNLQTMQARLPDSGLSSVLAAGSCR